MNVNCHAAWAVMPTGLSSADPIVIYDDNEDILEYLAAYYLPDILPPPSRRKNQCMELSPTRRHSMETAQEDACIICLEKVKDLSTLGGRLVQIGNDRVSTKRLVVKSSCQHTFHKNCIDRWKRSQTRGNDICPICRETLGELYVIQIN